MIMERGKDCSWQGNVSQPDSSDFNLNFAWTQSRQVYSSVLEAIYFSVEVHIEGVKTALKVLINIIIIFYSISRALLVVVVGYY